MMIVVIAVAVLAAFLLGNIALMELGREVIVVDEPSASGAIRKTRLWIVDDGPNSWIHPANANAQWWVKHVDQNATVAMRRRGETRRYRATADPEAHARVHQLMRAKYGVADAWVRFLAGSYAEKGFFTRRTCGIVPIRLEPSAALAQPAVNWGH